MFMQLEKHSESWKKYEEIYLGHKPIPTNLAKVVFYIFLIASLHNYQFAEVYYTWYIYYEDISRKFECRNVKIGEDDFQIPVYSQESSKSSLLAHITWISYKNNHKSVNFQPFILLIFEIIWVRRKIYFDRGTIDRVKIPHTHEEKEEEK